MTRVRITTPVSDHTGVVGNVYIRDGEGFADSETHTAEIAYCLRNGYTVEELPGGGASTQATEDESSETHDEESDPDGPPRRNGSTEAWRAYAVAHGIPSDEADQLTRDQLVERFTSTEETDQ